MIFYDDFNNKENIKAYLEKKGVKVDIKKLANFENYVSLEDISQAEKDDKTAYAILSLAGEAVSKTKFALEINTSYTANTGGMLGPMTVGTERKSTKTYKPLVSEDLEKVYSLLDVCIVLDRKNCYCYYVIIPGEVASVAASVLEEREQLQNEQLEINTSYEENLQELQRLEKLRIKTNEQLLEINSLSNRAREKQLLVAALNSLLS